MELKILLKYFTDGIVRYTRITLPIRTQILFSFNFHSLSSKNFTSIIILSEDNKVLEQLLNVSQPVLGISP